MELKNYLVRALDKQDISTYGLTFSVKTRNMALFTSVAIEKNEERKEGEPDSYNILYSKDFNPNLSEYFYYVKKVAKETLPPLLIEPSYKYYDQLDARKTSDTIDISTENHKNHRKYPMLGLPDYI